MNETKYKAGFFVILILLVGFIGGLFFAQYAIIEPKHKESTRLKGIIIDNKVYTLQEVVGQ